jgi:SchA/CurD like domain
MSTQAVIVFRIKEGCEQRARELFSIQNAEVSKRMGLQSNGVYILGNLVVRVITHDLSPEEFTEKLAKGHQQLAKFEAMLNEVVELPRDLMTAEGVGNYTRVVGMEQLFYWSAADEAVLVS